MGVTFVVGSGYDKHKLSANAGLRCIVGVQGAERASGQLFKRFGQFACNDSRAAVVARELTKTFEELARGTLRTLHTYYAAQPRIRGELVLVVAGTDYKSDPHWPCDRVQVTAAFPPTP